MFVWHIIFNAAAVWYGTTASPPDSFLLDN